MHKNITLSFTAGILTGSFISLQPEYSIVITQIFGGLLLYFFGLPPKNYHLSPTLLIGDLTSEQVSKNKKTEFYSGLGIVLFVTGQLLILLKLS